MKKTLYSIILLTAVMVGACRPERDDLYQLGTPPAAPEWSVEALPGDPNRFVVKDLSTGNFQRLWDFPGGAPKASSDVVDTVYFAKAGSYTLTLYVSSSEGNGTVFSQKTIEVLNDAIPDCTTPMGLLTGSCEADGKSWTMSTAAGAVKVGPTYDDYSWYTSPENGLQPAQYDDRFWFKFEGGLFENRNNGASVNPWLGYAVVPYEGGLSSFVLQEGTGINGRNQLILPDDQFMGVMDADNVMDIVQLTETDLVVRTRLRQQNGTPAAQGWFELHFVAQ